MSDELHDDSVEKERDPTERNALDHLPILIIVFLLILILLILEKVNHKEDRSSNGKRTNRLMIGVIIANATFTLCCLTHSTVCHLCPLQLALSFDTRWIMRWFNMLFMIHRAKLAQGMTPILSAKWFTKILPRIVTFVTVIFLMISTAASFLQESICRTYSDIDIQQCAVPERSDGTTDGENAYGVMVFLVGLDLVITVFLLTLFVVPLYRVYRTDLGVLNDNQLRQRRKLRTLLIWSVTMCFINQITSTFFMLIVVSDSQFIWILFSIGKFDPAINVWTSWLMITRNRQYLQGLLKCSCCRSQQTLSQMTSLQSAFTDASDMESHSRAGRFLRMFTRTQSNIPLRSEGDIQLVVEEEPNIQNESR